MSEVVEWQWRSVELVVLCVDESTNKTSISIRHQSRQITEVDTGRQTCGSVQDRAPQAARLPGLHAYSDSIQHHHQAKTCIYTKTTGTYFYRMNVLCVI